MRILAGDIGGTNTRLALFDENKKLMKDPQKFSSRKYASLKEIVKEYLQEKIHRACFGIAGPIEDNKCHATNLPWVIDGNLLGQEVGVEEVYLINDLLANAYGLRALKEGEFFVLNKGDPDVGNGALVSAGTGLGEAGLFWDGKSFIPFASEGGHADFAPRNMDEMVLLQHLQKEFGHVSYERLVSGPGLSNIYHFLVEEKGQKGFEKKIDENLLPRLISKEGQLDGPEAAKNALEWFISIYGSEAGNMALKFLAVSGVYLGGGIAPRILEKLNEGHFMKAFLNKGRFRKFLQKIPVKIVLNDQAALLGSLEYALLQ